MHHRARLFLRLLAALSLAAVPLARADVVITTAGNATHGSTLTVSGAGNTLTVAPGPDVNADGATDDLIIGYNGNGSLTVSNGATVSAPGTGFGLTSLGGSAGTSGTLTISSGGSLSTLGLAVGGRPDATGTFLVTGTGSGTTIANDGWGFWVASPTSTATLTAGASLTSIYTDNGLNAGTFTVSAGATLTTGYATFDGYSSRSGSFFLDTSGMAGTYEYLGLTPPASLSATMLVTGAGTTWNNTGGLSLLGNIADNVALTITDRATLNHNGAIGLGTASTLTLSHGATATLANAVGQNADITLDGATLALTHGATLTGAKSVTVGTSYSTGTLSIAGGSTLNTAALYVGSYGEGYSVGQGTFLLTGAGSAVNVSGATSGATELNGSITITAGASLNTDRYLRLYSDATISAGGHLTTTYSTGSFTNYVQGGLLVTGTGSSFTLAKTLNIYGGTNSVLTVADHATLSLADRLYVGNNSAGALNLTSGATATTIGATIGYISVTNSNVDRAGHATVTGAGTLWNNTGSLNVGERRNGDLTISAGAVVNSTSVTIGVRDFITAAVTVTGIGSQLNSTDTLQVGSGTLVLPTGLLTIADHARVTAQQTIVNSGDTLALGSFGTLVGGLTVNTGGTLLAHDGATFAYTLGSTTEANTLASGATFTLDPGATLRLTLSRTTGFDVGTYTLFSFASGATLNGLSPAAVSLVPDFSGYTYTVGLTTTELTVTVAPSAIPEPGTYAALAGLAALTLAAWRRRA